MDRRNFIKSVAAASASFSAGMWSSSCAFWKKPNVVLVVTDDQGYGDLACHGNTDIDTPQMDRLYAESVRLTNFHVGPTCAPTRAGLMTGRYCNRTGVWHTVMGRSLLRRDEITLADVFASAGYRTGFFGKWHLGDNYPFTPRHRGFQTVVRHGGGGIGQIPDYWDNDYFDDTYWSNGVPEKFEGYCTDIWFRQAEKFIETNKNRRFFCYLATNAPHGPFHVAEKYSQPYIESGIPVQRARFYGMITNIDDNLGRLRRKISDLGLADNTIFIFMTDNGTSAGCDVEKNGRVTAGYNAGMRGKKASPYDGGHRVPCFIHWPGGGLQRGRDEPTLSAHIDVLPTLVDLCGLKKPAVPLDGTSLRPLLVGRTRMPDRAVVTDSQRLEKPVKWRQSAVMTKRWRLINGSELYDMHRDSGQENDVSEKFPNVVRDLRMEYEKWWDSVSQRFDEYNPIVIGSEAENPVRLTCHDWHGVSKPGAGLLHKQGREVNPPWHQSHVRTGMEANGFWALFAEKSGVYEFELRRWPRVIDMPLDEGIPAGDPVPGGQIPPAGRAIPVRHAQLSVNGEQMDCKNVKGSKVTFRAPLERGPVRLKTALTGPAGTTLGAYFVYITFVEQSKGQ